MPDEPVVQQEKCDATPLRNRIADRAAPLFRHDVQTTVKEEKQGENLHHAQQKNRFPAPFRPYPAPRKRRRQRKQRDGAELDQTGAQFAAHPDLSPVGRQIGKTLRQPRGGKRSEGRPQPFPRPLPAERNGAAEQEDPAQKQRQTAQPVPGRRHLKEQHPHHERTEQRTLRDAPYRAIVPEDHGAAHQIQHQIVAHTGKQDGSADQHFLMQRSGQRRLKQDRTGRRGGNQQRGPELDEIHIQPFRRRLADGNADPDPAEAG